MEKRIPLKTDRHLFYKQLLQLLNPILKLRKNELVTLAEIMQLNNTLINVPREHRIQLLLNTQNRKDLRTKLKFTEANFNNNLSSLKKKGYITDFGLKQFLDIPYNPSLKLIFEFNSNEQ